VTSVRTREMRVNPTRPNLLYYAEVTLPFSLGSGVFDGPAVVTWLNASNAVFESRGYRLADEHTAGDDEAPYRQIHSDYALDLSSSGLLSRHSVEHDAAGIVQARRRWHDPNATSGGYDETTYTYDALGRIDEVISPTGTITKAGRPEEGTIPAEPGYDFLDRPKVRSISTTGATGSPKWTVVSRNHYDSVPDGDDDVDGVGNGNLTVTRMPLDETLANDRVYRNAYDFRSRRVSTTSPTSPHEIVVHDNLDRIVGRALVAGSAAPSTIDLDSADSARRSLSRTTYSQRGVAIRQETAIDPTLVASSRTYLASNSWLDAVGRTVGTWSPSSPATKTTYDGLGRTTTTYITDRGGDANPQPSTGSYSGYADVHASNASVLTGDTVLEQVSYRYITATGLRQGLPDLTTVRRRAHDDTSTGSLVGSTTAIVSYSMTFYDGAERVVRTANYGTGQSVFETGGAAPTDTQASPPASSDFDEAVIRAAAHFAPPPADFARRSSRRSQDGRRRLRGPSSLRRFIVVVGHVGTRDAVFAAEPAVQVRHAAARRAERRVVRVGVDQGIACSTAGARRRRRLHVQCRGTLRVDRDANDATRLGVFDLDDHRVGGPLHVSGSADGAEHALWPFQTENQPRIAAQLVPADALQILAAAHAPCVDVDQRRYVGRGVLLAEHEGRAAHDAGVVAETLGDAGDQRRLAGAERAEEENQLARTQQPTECCADAAHRHRIRGRPLNDQLRLRLGRWVRFHDSLPPPCSQPKAPMSCATPSTTISASGASPGADATITLPMRVTGVSPSRCGTRPSGAAKRSS